MQINLTIEGNPIPASRPRVSRWGTYNEPKYENYKKIIEVEYWNKYHNKQVFDRGVPLVAKLHFYRPIQKSLSKKEHERRARHEVKPVVKPDLDNYEKAIYDGLKSAWFDDGQIFKHENEKDYDEHPRVEIEVYEWKFEEEKEEK